MNWNTDELAGTLRAEMGGHPPVVVTRGGATHWMKKWGKHTSTESVRTRLPSETTNNLKR